MSSDRPRVGIVGLGRWGQALVSAAASHAKELRFTHAITRTPAKAEDFCKLHGLALSDDYEALLADPEVDAVVLATPHSQHGGQIRAAAAAGKHVFVEKPLALTIADAATAVAAAEEAGAVLAVGFNRRFLPAFQALAGAHDAGTLGRLLHAEGNFSGPFGFHYTRTIWRGAAGENPAGGMAAMGIHVLDAMLSLMGPVRRVATVSRRLAVSSDVDDTTTVTLEFASGATGQLSTLMATASFWRLHLFGSKGWGQMPDQNQLILCDLAGEQSAESFEAVDTLALELDAFAAAVRGRGTYPVTLQQALMGVATMVAISESADEGGTWKEVRIP